ncbi:hypothetical protein MJO28_013726 [Puccinia striiformis f. sp. tritici]|uniref:Uncharacterized protein n=1 Tax=Puccinia striiformis f. sp. tritici TaxID=168172 RepID=A0ACC0DVK4_9BASI|nr:hypothetical protein Pst134EA_025735 [Puccinia striiformis f. sp. tritici]KAH9443958.1 hypothetical protein Pst134EB_026347 [Puccinia striiformis f. sp. tritici]KAH9451797.1 hypothetical protein Pst134EA_025735 [Puccinia striiformis f. sp. tritici]KAI7940074.1 hypothetical protein MJO28_013726 [Puccinia striiformis f. sp. tritici]KAI7941486.1 hypothetical protein MJO29_013560 [Puccinia striiformis f. sp. tritici]
MSITSAAHPNQSQVDRCWSQLARAVNFRSPARLRNHTHDHPLEEDHLKRGSVSDPVAPDEHCLFANGTVVILQSTRRDKSPGSGIDCDYVLEGSFNAGPYVRILLTSPTPTTLNKEALRRSEAKTLLDERIMFNGGFGLDNGFLNSGSSGPSSVTSSTDSASLIGPLGLTSNYDSVPA